MGTPNQGLKRLKRNHSAGGLITKPPKPEEPKVVPAEKLPAAGSIGYSHTKEDRFV